MRFSTLVELVLASAFTITAIGFFAQAANIGGPNAMPLCGYAIAWGAVALVPSALLLSRLKNGNI